MLLLSSDGGLYMGHLQMQSTDSSFLHESNEEFVEQKSNRRPDICEQSRCEITLERIPNIDRVTDVSVDQRGESFVILQVCKCTSSVLSRLLIYFSNILFSGKFQTIFDDACVAR